MNILSKLLQLSLETATIVFSLLVTLVFGFSLFMIAGERTEEFIDYHHSISSATTTSIGNEIERMLLQKKNLVITFLDDNKLLVTSLALNPQSKELYAKLNIRLGRYFSDYLSSNIITENGDFTIADLAGNISDLCLLDTRTYLDSDEELIRIHPGPRAYHYDILTELKVGKKKMVFFVSLNTSDIAKLLKSSAPDKHNMLIVNSHDNTIEISSIGSRDQIIDRIDPRLTVDEQRRTLSSFHIPGTHWDVIDVRKKGLFSGYRMRLLKQGAMIYAFFLALALFMSLSLLIGIRKKNRLQSFLLEKNKKIIYLNSELEKLSLTDGLTGLYNRRYLDIYGPTEMSTARRLNVPLNIAIIDIDFFKQYNDTYGHQAGDACIKQVTKLLSDAFRRSNESAARYGGEEFIIMNLGDDSATFTARLQQFSSQVQAINIEHINSKVSNHVTVSIGIASTEHINADTIDELIGKSDAALYLAKQGGRNQLVSAQA